MAIEALVGSGSPVLRPGFFLCTLGHEPANSVHKKHNARRYGHPSSGVPGSIGVGRSGLSLLTWNKNSAKFAVASDPASTPKGESGWGLVGFQDAGWRDAGLICGEES
jgi:hypothetical protein